MPFSRTTTRLSYALGNTVSQGFMWEIAEEFRALVVFAEHRYYGVSMPYGNKSFDDISRVGYLTSQQALADYVDLITYLRHNGSYSNRAKLYQTGDIYDAGVDGGTPAPSAANPVIAFGGSYGGMLAAWFRIKYPAIVEGLVVMYNSHVYHDCTSTASCTRLHAIRFGSPEPN